MVGKGAADEPALVRSQTVRAGGVEADILAVDGCPDGDPRRARLLDPRPLPARLPLPGARPRPLLPRRGVRPRDPRFRLGGLAPLVTAVPAGGRWFTFPFFSCNFTRVMDTVENVVRKFRAAGLKVTPQRISILEILQGN